MNRNTFKTMLATSVALFWCSVASAQDAESVAAEPEERVFDVIVVTARASAERTLFESSVSVSTITLDQAFDFAPRSSTELFRNLPGVRSESSGGEGNANIVVRGLPLAAGGSRFVQLQEDGLPILAFGDITFGTQDQFLRVDTSIGRVEAIRGGSASTFASNAPGAVINLISKTGETEGGSIGLTRGLGFDTTRVDFEYGAPIADDLFFHVGGFYRTGEGLRDIGFNGEEGGQIKINATKEFEKGYLRLHFKHLNDRTFPSFPQPFVLESGSATPIIGFDGRDEALVSNNLLDIPRLSPGGEVGFTDVEDGIRSIVTAVGAEFEVELAQGWAISNKTRFTANRGGFLGIFPTAVVDAESFAATVPGGTSLQFVGGINDGQIITDPGTLNGNGLLATQLVFDVDLRNLNQFINDARLSNSFKTEKFGNFDIEIGYYKSVQQIETDYFFTFFTQEVLGSDAALVDVLDAAGNPLTVNGFTALGPGGFNPEIDLAFDRDAFFASINWQFGGLTFDGSVRYEDVQGTGASSLGTPATSDAGGFVLIDADVNNDGVITPGVETGINAVDLTNLFGIDYDVDYFSYSFGLNYTVTDDLALFARFSRGGVVNADRLLLGAGAATFNADGGLTDEGSGLDLARQVEWGIKYRSTDRFIPGDVGIFLTAFYSDVEISTFDITEAAAGALDQQFQAFGVEVDTNYRLGPFSFQGSFTYTDAEIASDAVGGTNSPLVGNRPQRQARFIYQLTPTLDFNTFVPWSIGANFVGTTSSFAQDNNDIVQPGFVQTNLFLNVEVFEDLVASLNVNNINNAFGITEINDFAVPTNGILRGRSIPGRTISFSVRYRF